MVPSGPVSNLSTCTCGHCHAERFRGLVRGLLQPGLHQEARRALLYDDDLAGESRYQPLMEGAYARLEADGLLREDDGSMIVDVPGFENRDGEPLPFIV